MVSLLGNIGLELLWLWILLGLLLIAVIVVLALVPIKVWFRALISGAHISMSRLIGMKLRKINIGMIVEAYVSAKKAGITIDINELETHYMAGGDVVKVVNALISAHSAKIGLSIDTAKAIDLAGRDVLNAVKVSVNPKVIETPSISAIAKDGIELHVKARVTVKANIGRLVGGAGEETIIARVGEGIVTTVGSAETHAEVLQNPAHPYTRGLMACDPARVETGTRLPVIAGTVPPLGAMPAGCPFHPRCPQATDICKREAPCQKSSGEHRVWCHLA